MDSFLLCEVQNLYRKNGKYFMLTKRFKALGSRCIGSLGSLLRHPKTVKLVIRMLGGILIWLMKIAIVALLSNIGIAIPKL